MLLAASGVRILILSIQRRASSSSRRCEISSPSRSRASDRMPMFSAIDHSGEDAVGLAVASDQRHWCLDLDALRRARSCLEYVEQEPRLAVPGESGEADDSHLRGPRARRHRAAVGRARTADGRGACRSDARSAPARACFLRAHGGDQLVAVEGGGGAAATTCRRA
jgi:hypothetical protein